MFKRIKLIRGGLLSCVKTCIGDEIWQEIKIKDNYPYYKNLISVPFDRAKKGKKEILQG